MTQLVWFVTGCSTGFGRELVLAALSRGDKVIATARNASKLELLKEAGADTMQLDVTASLDDLLKKRTSCTAVSMCWSTMQAMLWKGPWKS